MRKYTLKNGLRVIIYKREGSLTSINLGLKAGAIEDKKLGSAHFLEHMLYKRTKNKGEEEINILLDEIFGFQNAMTNYSYVIYYGTLLSRDFEKGIELFSDIILNPNFTKKDLEEERRVIKEELREWQDDLEQFCEDSLLFNAFSNKRIKERIIGSNKSIETIELEDLEEFYKENYFPENCVISIVSSLEESKLLLLIEKYFGNWEGKGRLRYSIEKEKNQKGTFINKRNTEGAKVQMLYSIDGISFNEIKSILLFKNLISEGVSSTLYSIVRGKEGLAYDIGAELKGDKGVEYFKIYANTSKENSEKVISLVKEVIEGYKLKNIRISKEDIIKASKKIKLKRELLLEKSIQLAKEITTYELMYGDFKRVFNEVEGLEKITEEEINNTINKYFIDPTIEILE